jgi:hypothetical protein
LTTLFGGVRDQGGVDGNHILVTLRGIESLAESGARTHMLNDAVSVALEVLRLPAQQQ